MTRRGLLALVLLVGCATPAPPTATCEEGGVRARSEAPIQRVEVWQGGLRQARRDAAGLPEVRVPATLQPGPVEVRVRRRDGEHVLSCDAEAWDGPLRVRIAAPAGQGLRRLDGDLPFTAFPDAALELAVVVTARRAGEATVTVGGEATTLRFVTAEQREAITRPLPIDAPTTVEVRSGDWSASGVLRPTLLADTQLAVVEQRFPADAVGRREPARAAGRVTLPSRVWSQLLDTTGLGVAGRDESTPWSFHGITVANRGDQPINLVLRSRVLDGDQPAAAFRPRVRDADGDTGVVSGLLRVPARGTADAVLPLFVDDAELPEGASAWTHELRLRPLGSSQDLLVERTELIAQRGSTLLATGFALTLLFGLFGTGGALVMVPRWLRRFRTADLTTIAVFGTLGFVVSAATAVVGSAVAALLGPFATFLTALVNDSLRHALMATLVVLLPRPGTATLFVVVGWLMQGIALGGFHADDVIFVGCRLAFLESMLWISGLSRGGAWRDGPRWVRWLRLSAGFATASLLTNAAGLVAYAVLFRLYYADWYVAATLVGPGFVYDLLACGLAVGFSESLRRVEP